MKREDKLSMGNDPLGGQIYTVKQRSKTVSQDREQKRINISLRFPTAIALAVGGAVILAWVFFLGVLLGRGYMPEENIPQLENMLPVAADPAPAVVVGQAAPAAAGGVDANRAESIASLVQNPSAQPVSSAAQKPAPAPKPETSKPAGSGKPEATKPTPNKPEATKPTPAKPEAAKPSDSSKGKEIFDYTFQVAAYKDKASAEAFVARLKKDGLNGSISVSKDAGGVTWHRVIMPLRGTADDVTALQDKLKKYGINKIMRQGKQPVKG